MDGDKLDEKLVKLKAAAKAAPANKRVAEQLQNALDVQAKIAKDAKAALPRQVVLTRSVFPLQRHRVGTQS